MVIYYVFAVSDSTISSGSPFVAGLTPTFVSLKTTGATQTSVVSSATISAVGGGLYQIAYDPETYGEAAGIIDCTSTIPTNADRYLPIELARDSSRIQAGINSSGQVTLASFGYTVSINTSQVLAGVPRALDSVADSALTVGDALVAAIVGSAGKESYTGTALVRQTPSGATTTRTFTVSTSPTTASRS